MKSNLFESGSKKTIATQTDYSLGSATCFPNVVCAPSYDNSGFPTMFRNYSGVITPEELMRHQEVTNELNLMKTKDNSKKLHKELIGDLFEGQLNVYVTYCKDMEMGDCTDVVYKNILLKDFTFSDIFYVCTNLYSNQDYIYTIKDDRNCSLREFLQGISSTNEKIEITGLDLKNHLKCVVLANIRMSVLQRGKSFSQEQGRLINKAFDRAISVDLIVNEIRGFLDTRIRFFGQGLPPCPRRNVFKRDSEETVTHNSDRSTQISLDII